ncbi:hypothetical protein [Roseovarius sp. EL26]|uniref:hypothetical protein n=1 Tax=Roseovarius sp. EL26 TaxID=2126672 RepID=UPI000EA223E5|nr:hypothetical protein [Roseovarius sp. EL26]
MFAVFAIGFRLGGKTHPEVCQHFHLSFAVAFIYKKFQSQLRFLNVLLERDGGRRARDSVNDRFITASAGSGMFSSGLAVPLRLSKVASFLARFMT